MNATKRRLPIRIVVAGGGFFLFLIVASIWFTSHHIGARNGQSLETQQPEPIQSPSKSAPEKQNIEPEGTHQVLDPEMKEIEDLVNQGIGEVSTSLTATLNVPGILQKRQTLEEVTVERMQKAKTSRVVSGRVQVSEAEELLTQDDRPLRVYVKGIGKSQLPEAVMSAVVGGQFNLGEVPEGRYEVFLAERTHMPGIVVRIPVEEERQCPEISFEFGDCTAEVTVLEGSRPFESDQADLMLGGIDDEKHMFKRSHGIKSGEWVVKRLIPGTYLVSIVLPDGRNAGNMVTLSTGINRIALNLEPEEEASQ